MGAGLTAVGGGGAGLFGAGSKGGEGGGVSGNTMGVGEVLGLWGGERDPDCRGSQVGWYFLWVGIPICVWKWENDLNPQG